MELRRIQFDLITVYKIFHNYLDIPIEKFFAPIRTRYNLRKHSLALQKPLTATTNILKNCFKYRVIEAWNSLPDAVVTNPSLIVFKLKLHKISFERFVQEQC